MNITEAAKMLGDLLEVTLERYPDGVRTVHLNQAIDYLGKRFETSYNEGVGHVLLEAGDTSFIASNLSDIGGNTIQAEVIEALYFSDDFNEIGSSPGNWTTNVGWEKIQIYSSLEALLDVAKESDDGILYGSAQRAGIVYVLNAQSNDLLLKAIFNGAHFYTTTQNNWLIYAPYPVIYKAACYACAYLEDEMRIPVYERLMEDAVEVVNLADSMRNDSPVLMQEA